MKSHHPPLVLANVVVVVLGFSVRQRWTEKCDREKAAGEQKAMWDECHIKYSKARAKTELDGILY